jgi:hypothetical protein
MRDVPGTGLADRDLVVSPAGRVALRIDNNAIHAQVVGKGPALSHAILDVTHRGSPGQSS